MSRTRRMCRLLVDCDNNLTTPTFVDKKESEKNTKDNIHTPTNSKFYASILSIYVSISFFI